MAVSRIVRSGVVKQDYPKRYTSFLAGNPYYVPATMDLIATVTAAGGETSLSFTNIPQTYVALQIRGIARDQYSGGILAGSPIYVRMNGDTGANYSRHTLFGDGSAVFAYGAAARTYMTLDNACVLGSAAAGIFAASVIDIQNYASTSANKTMRAFWGANANTSDANFEVGFDSGGWFSTAAVTSITLFGGYAFAAGTQFRLFGIKGAV